MRRLCSIQLWDPGLTRLFISHSAFSDPLLLGRLNYGRWRGKMGRTARENACQIVGPNFLGCANITPVISKRIFVICDLPPALLKLRPEALYKCDYYYDYYYYRFSANKDYILLPWNRSSQSGWWLCSEVSMQVLRKTSTMTSQ